MPSQLAPPAGDLDHVLAHTEGLWEDLRGRRIFITGGTGFFGWWLLESFARANDRLRLKAQAVVLSRHPQAFQAMTPRLAENPAIQFHPGDVRDFNFPAGEFTHLIHAATEVNAATRPLDPADHFIANVRGTQRVLEFARHCRAARLLFTSSGAVYGRQPSDMPLLSEDFSGAPLPADLATAYGQSKRASEFLCLARGKKENVAVTIARPFAFVGPRLKLDANFAIGNFIRDALTGNPIQVQGDGTTVRSYLYAADLAIWLWTILLRGEPGRTYNVGSDQPITIAELAQRVASVTAPESPVLVRQKPAPSKPATRYVPAVTRARRELGLDIWVPLEEAIRRTAQWYRN